MCLRFVHYITYYSVTCRSTHLCLSCNSLYSSSRITTPARVSRRRATLMSKLQHNFPAGPGEPQFLGGCGVWRDPSIPCLESMMAWTRAGWFVSNRIWCGFLGKGWGGIWREALPVTWWSNCIAGRFDQYSENCRQLSLGTQLQSIRCSVTKSFQSLHVSEGSYCVAFPSSWLSVFFFNHTNTPITVRSETSRATPAKNPVLLTCGLTVMYTNTHLLITLFIF